MNEATSTTLYRILLVTLALGAFACHMLFGAPG